jgi:hypothetical protein
MSAHNNESMGEVLPNLWVGNLMSVSKLLQTQAAPPHLHLTTSITIISVLSNKNLIRLVKDILEQYRLKQGTDDVNSATCIRHEVIELKDVAESDLLSILPDALKLVDEALGHHPNNHDRSFQTIPVCNKNDNEENDINGQLRRICLVHCARGASRSVSVAIAYLLSRHRSRFKSFEEALQHVRRVRPVASPNVGFSSALKRFESTLHEE